MSGGENKDDQAGSSKSSLVDITQDGDASEEPRDAAKSQEEKQLDESNVLEYLQQRLEIQIPEHLKELLHYQGFDNLVSISAMNDDVLKEIVKFAQECMSLVIEKDEYPKYFGRQADPKKFFLIPGHKILLKKIAEMAKTCMREKTQTQIAPPFRRLPESKRETKTCTKERSRSPTLGLEKLKGLLEENLRSKNLPEDAIASITLHSSGDSAVVECTCKVNVSIRKHGGRWTNLFNFGRHVASHDEPEEGKLKRRRSQQKRKDQPEISTAFQKASRKKTKLLRDEAPEHITVEVDVHAEGNTPDSDDDDLSSAGKSSFSTRKKSDIFEDSDEMDEVIGKIDYSSQSTETLCTTPTSSTDAQETKEEHAKDVIRTRSKWSRHYRTQMHLEKAAEGVHKITDFFPVLNEIEILLKENERLRHNIDSCLETMHSKNKPNHLVLPENASHFLKVLVQTSIDNEGKKKGGQRYQNCELKSFCDYLFITGGRHNYTTLQSNLQGCLPSVATVERHMKLAGAVMQDGEFRFGELATYLREHHYPPMVWVAEDATRCKGCPEYDATSNQMLGYVAPLNEDGIPRSGAFPATSSSVMEQYAATETIAGGIYCFMAQPVVEGSSPFCLMMCGTDSKFNHLHVLKRWKWMKREAAKYGIEILGFSSDGDEKLLKAMRISTFPASVSSGSQWEAWFHADLNQRRHSETGNFSKFFTVQDHIHLVTKLRNRLLNPSILMPMGDLPASQAHIRILLQENTKDLHCLTESDLNVKDKMNYRSAEKLCDPKVLQLLEETVPGSAATVVYLRIMSDISRSYLDRSLEALERVHILWKSLFFLRIWRQWLIKSQYVVKDAFVTLNAYHCVEVNAHALIQVMRYLRDKNMPFSFFTTWLFSSQSCENYFRKTRSLTSTLHTAVNFTVKELLARGKRIDLLSKVSNELSSKYSFPRQKKVATNTDGVGSVTAGTFPTDAEILRVVQQSREEALFLARNLGMDMPSYAADAFIDFSHCDESDMQHEDSDWEEETSNLALDKQAQGDEGIELDVAEDICMISSGAVGLRTFEDVQIHPESPFVEVQDSKGKRSIVRKTSLCWALRRGISLVSSDRTLRVKAPMPCAGEDAHDVQHPPNPIRAETISIGDWVLFKGTKSTNLIGRVMCFKNLKGKKKRDTDFFGTSAPTSTGSNGLGVYCTWYSADDYAELHIKNDMVHEYLPMKSYQLTLPRPKVLDGCLGFSLANFSERLQQILETVN